MSDRERPPTGPLSRAEVPRAFGLLWGGTSAANLADGIALAVVPLLAATITRDPALVAAVTVAGRLPWFLLALVSGVLVDRFPRRVMLVLGNLLRVGALGGIGVAVLLDVREIWVLCVAMFLIGTAETFVDNASLAIVPELVRRDRLADANGRLFTTQSVLNELVGPPVGSLVFAVSTVAAFSTGSVAYLIAAGLFALLPRTVVGGVSAGHGSPQSPPQSTPQSPPPPERFWPALVDGMRWFWRIPILRLLAPMAGVSNLCSAAGMAVLVLVASERLGIDSAGYGLLLTAAAAGGIPGGLLAPRILRRIGEGPGLFVANLLPAIGWLLLAVSDSAVLVGAGLALGTFAATMGNVVVMTLRQSVIPNRVLGRVTSVYRLIALGALPIGAALGGVLASTFGLTAPYWFGAVVMATLALGLAPILRTSRIRALPPGDPDA